MKKFLAIVMIATLLCVPCMAGTPIQGLPPGLTLSSSGLISGTPTAMGAYQFKVQVCDSETPPQCVTATLGITIYGAMAIAGRTVMPIGFVNDAYGPDGAGVQLHVIGGNGTNSWSVE